MTDYILRLIAEGRDSSGELDSLKPLELRVEGEILKEGMSFVIDKEYPPCEVTYDVTSVKRRIKMPKEPQTSYHIETIVSALRQSGGYKKK